VKSFRSRLAPHVDAEIGAARAAERSGKFAVAFTHLERAHVLGQASTYQHVRVHCLMLAWGWRQGSVRECLGQLFRIVGAATKTAFGLIPKGNTGGSNVSPFKVLPVPSDLEAIIRSTRSSR
jgi:hypothetical protein